MKIRNRNMREVTDY